MLITEIVMIIGAACAALLHVFIWYMEAFAWETKARGVFGHSAEEAVHTKELAFNMGFYNLFLAIITFVGLAIAGTSTGVALILAGTGSMLAAAILLFFTSPDKRSAAIKQGMFPLVAVIFALLAL